MARKCSRNHTKPIEYLGCRIEYSHAMKRWFVQDYDYDLGWYDAMSAATKSAAMKKIEQNQGIYI